MLVGLASCQAHHGIVVLVENADPNVRAIRLYIGTGDSATSSLTPSSKVQVDDAEYWVRDPGNTSDVVTVDGQSELRFVFDTDASIPVAIAVGYDKDQLPIAAGLVHDLSPVDGSDFAGYELTLTSPIAPLGAQGQPMQIALWSPDAATSQFDATCVGVVVAGEDHPYFVVAEEDQDCDGLLDNAALECNPDVYLGMRPADPNEASCLVPSTGAAGDNDCQLGGEPCTDNVPRGTGMCVASHTCVPFDLCTLCGSSFDCAADLQGAGHTDLGALVHYECPLQRKPDGSACGDTLVLDRPPTGGYDCTTFEIGDANTPLGDKLTVGGVELAATMHLGSGTSCAGELAVSGQVATAGSFTALVAFTLKNKAGVAIPIHFSASGVACAAADVRCTLVGPAFSDPALTECAAQWGMPTVVSPLIGPNGDSADPTLPQDQLTVYFVGNGALYTSHRTAINAPWETPMAVHFNGVSADERISLPKVSADGSKMFLSLINTISGVDTLSFATVNTAATDWNPPLPVVYLGPMTLTLTSAAFGPNNTVLVGAQNQGNLDRDLFEGTFDETSRQIDNLVQLPLDTPFAEDAPSLSADGLQLYFQSDATSVTVPYVASRRTVDDKFTTATRLDELEGGSPFDGSPWVSNGARTIYFTSDRVGGTPRVYSATRTTF
jgi:hypothetical protein